MLTPAAVPPEAVTPEVTEKFRSWARIRIAFAVVLVELKAAVPDRVRVPAVAALESAFTVMVPAPPFTLTAVFTVTPPEANRLMLPPEELTFPPRVNRKSAVVTVTTSTTEAPPVEMIPRVRAPRPPR
jgi:hypothetical protein